MMYIFDINLGEPYRTGANKKAKDLFRVFVRFDHTAMKAGQLNSTAGEILDIVELFNPFWWQARNQKGETGLVSRNFVTYLSTGTNINMLK